MRIETPYRKFVDWEISAGLAQGMALLGVELPQLQIVNDRCAKPARLQDNIDLGYAAWVWWENLTASTTTLGNWIEDAKGRSKSKIVNDRARRTRNG
jgi:hypothetical protein